MTGGRLGWERALVIVERADAKQGESAIMVTADRLSKFNARIAEAAAAGFRLLTAGNSRREIMGLLQR